MFKSVNENLLYSVFQPIWDLNEQRIIGYEALLRHEENIPPDVIFEKVKENGELFAVDTYSILLGISTLSKTAEGYIFINIFSSTILHEKFISFLKKMSELTAEGSYRVVFEINEQESNLWKDKKFKHLLNKIREEGYSIAFDDVGVENVSIKDVIIFSPQFIKIDRSFSVNLAVDPQKQKALQRIINQVKHPVRIILEGLETESDLFVSKRMKVPLGQGYFLGKPNRNAIGIQ